MNNYSDKKGNAGFTLIELMVVVGIVGVIVGVGYPSYINSVKKAQRADAIDALLAEVGTMEGFYLNASTYAGASLVSATSPEGLYNMTVAIPAGGLSYTLTATPVSTDTECTTLTLNSLGQKGATGTASSSCW